MARKKLFRTNRPRVVRPPKDIGCPKGGPEIAVAGDGGRRIIGLEGAAWDDFFDGPGIDLGTREPLGAQVRKTL